MPEEAESKDFELMTNREILEWLDIEYKKIEFRLSVLQFFRDHVKVDNIELPEDAAGWHQKIVREGVSEVLILGNALVSILDKHSRLVAVSQKVSVIMCH